jgi:hypothetical protein
MAKKAKTEDKAVSHGLPLRKQSAGDAKTKMKQKVCHVSPELFAKLQSHPEVNWSEVMRKNLEDTVSKL